MRAQKTALKFTPSDADFHFQDPYSLGKVEGCVAIEKRMAAQDLI